MMMDPIQQGMPGGGPPTPPQGGPQVPGMSISPGVGNPLMMQQGQPMQNNGVDPTGQPDPITAMDRIRYGDTRKIQAVKVSGTKADEKKDIMSRITAKARPKLLTAEEIKARRAR